MKSYHEDLLTSFVANIIRYLPPKTTCQLYSISFSPRRRSSKVCFFQLVGDTDEIFPMVEVNVFLEKYGGAVLWQAPSLPCQSCGSCSSSIMVHAVFWLSTPYHAYCADPFRGDPVIWTTLIVVGSTLLFSSLWNTQQLSQQILDWTPSAVTFSSFPSFSYS